VRVQIESFAPLAGSRSPRGSAIEGILLTSADLDHSLGLFALREGNTLAAHAPGPIRRAVSEDLGAGRILESYCGINWFEPPTHLSELLNRDGSSSGLHYSAFPVAGKPPRYVRDHAPSAGDVIGVRFFDPATGGRMICVPGIATIDAAAMKEFRDADLLLLDGTFWREDEMIMLGIGTTTASQMGHCPVGGPEGSLARVAGHTEAKLVFIHMNNTNPMLVDGSPEYKAVKEAGAVIGADGMEFRL
jgi:pyrroloquinoline quinone biosynthesis protein B